MDSSQATRLLLVDDHEIVRRGVREILMTRKGLRVVGEAGDGQAAVEAAKRERPDLTVMDVSLPGLSGIAATAEIRRSPGAGQVLILSMHDETRTVESALRAGACGYVLKTCLTRELLTAIDVVGQGRRYLSPRLAGLGIGDGLGDPGVEGGISELTGREREVLRHLAEGLTAKRIAEELAISLRTVETHRSNIMRKLGVHRTPCLVRIAIREGLVSV